MTTTKTDHVAFERLTAARSILSDAIVDAKRSLKPYDQLACLKFGYYRANSIIPDKSQTVPYKFYNVESLQADMETRFRESETGSKLEKRTQAILGDIVKFYESFDETAHYQDNIISFDTSTNRYFEIPLTEMFAIVDTYNQYLDERYKDYIMTESQELKKYGKASIR